LRYILPLFIALSLISCRFNDSDGKPRAEKIAHPDIILEDASYKLNQQSENPIVLEGSKITFYSADHRADLESFTFYQENSDGERVMEGSADIGTVDTANETLNLSGKVVIRQKSNNIELRTDSVMIDTKQEEISSPSKVMVKSDKGTFTGIGFKGDMKRQVYTFTALDKGEIEI